MRRFHDTQSSAIIGLSLKCMFSFFKRNPRFEEIDRSGDVDYFICRHPCHRVVSLYYDKCVQRSITQDCQRVLLEETGRSDFSGFTLSNLIEVLPKVLEKDEHFWPQVKGYNLRSIAFFTMEHELPWLSKRLELDLSTKQNSTIHPAAEELLSWKNARDISSIYEEDFETFGYTL